MAAVDDILSKVDLDQLAAQVGEDPQKVEQAARAALPALLGGLQANAQDPGGAASLTEALSQHDDDLLEGGVSLDQVDTGDGERITQHIFGDNREQVVNQLGGVGGVGGGLVAKLLPILAPMVLSWLAKQVLGGRSGGAAGGTAGAGTGGAGTGGGGMGDLLEGMLGGGGSRPSGTAQSGPSLPSRVDAPQSSAQGAGGGSLQDLLGSVLGQAAGGGAAGRDDERAGGGSITDLLGGLLGKGRR